MTQLSACAAARFGTAPTVPSRDVTTHPANGLLTRTGISILAASAGLAVANANYAQPLLVDIGHSLQLSNATVGLMPALTQLGVSLGVLCLLPLGDVMPVRRLLTIAILLQVIALAMTAVAPTGATLLLVSLLVGFFGITPYVLPPYATLRAPPERRGHVTALLAQGVIVGMLLARSISGVLGLHFGWRSVYALAALAMLAMLIPLRRTVQDVPTSSRTSYRALMRSLLDVFLTVPAARWSALCQAAATGSFTALWVGISFYVQSPAFNWRSDGVGGLALIGAAAAVFAPFVGRIADRKGPRRSLLLALATLTLSWLLLFGFGGHVAGIIIGMIVLDLGATAADISNRTVIFSLHPEIRTRLATIYMVGKFGGAGLMAWLAGVVWSYAGWPGVCALGGASAAAALLIALCRIGRPAAP
jgi:predicted MFS family arabinose efflux permease